jgi:cell division protein YceG involved in septum cleavage
MFNIKEIGKIIFGLFCLIVFLILGRREILRIEREEHYKNIVSISITIPEGFNLNQIADTASSKLKNFNKARFLLQTKELEGYLFPDTYFFLTNGSDGDVIKSMSDNFNKKITPLLPEITQSGKT